METGETRVFPLPTEPATGGSSATDGGGNPSVLSIGFFDEATAYTSGGAGLRRWNLERGTNELVAAGVLYFELLGDDRRRALTTTLVDGSPTEGSELRTRLQVRDLVSGTTRPLPPFETRGVVIRPALSGEIAAMSGPAGVLVGRLSTDTAHILVGHEGSVQGVAISPDGRWVATSAGDNTLRLWPMPDLSKAPLHTLPHDELVAKLRTFTNLRVVRDPKSPASWKIEVGPFPGWKDVPTW